MESQDIGWRHQFGMSARFDNIKKMQAPPATDSSVVYLEYHLISFKTRTEAISRSSPKLSYQEAQKSAFAAEIEAFTTAVSYEDYLTTCNVISLETEEVGEELPNDDLLSDQQGIDIGTYKNCRHVAEGLTSHVYRAENRALKVITDTKEMQPHNPSREVKILRELRHPNIIQLLDSFVDKNNRLVLIFDFAPLTLATLIDSASIPEATARSIFRGLFQGLAYLHARGIIHRDVKASNILLTSQSGPARLADFGTAWHPVLSSTDEPAHNKVLDVGTTCYRAPETLFGHRSYDSSLDMWAAGALVAECSRRPPQSLFESRGACEDGNQLALILSIFRTIGTPTKESWPEAARFTTPPFEWYKTFPGRPFAELLPEASDELRDLVTGLVVYESGRRMTAKQVLQHPYFQRERQGLN